MSRNAVVYELSDLIRQIDGMCRRAEGLARASGGLVEPGRFVTAQGCITLAAGDLDQKGLWLDPVQADASTGTGGAP